MDKLQSIISYQSALQTRIGNRLRDLSIDDKEKWTEHFIMAIHCELTELMDGINWKSWKKTKIKHNAETIKYLQMEIIDILHFWANLCLIWDMDAEKIMELYVEKNKVNFQRQDSGY